MKGNIFDAVQELSDLMRINGHIYPVANEPLTLNAEFTDGSKLLLLINRFNGFG